MRYTQLTQDERYLIQQWKGDGHNGSEIARRMGRDRSTISRELRRNRGVHQWRPAQAHGKALERQKKGRNARRIDKRFGRT